MALLPNMGRGAPLVARLSGLGNPGWKKVNETTEFMAGMVVSQDSDGLIIHATASTQPAGIALQSKINSFYTPVVAEEVTFADGIGILKHANAAKVLVISSTGVELDLTTDYTLGLIANGIITSVTIPDGETCTVSYLYLDPNKAGMDETLPTGLISIANLPGEISTLVYDTSVAYAVNAALYSDADGYITTSGTKKIGYVTVAPTSDKPALVFMLDIAQP